MNQRLQGWQLALALLIPAAIIGAAGYVAYGALSDDDQGVATGGDAQTALDTATATALPETSPVDASQTPDATALPAPTALTVPSPVPAPAATAVVATATATPAPTAAPRPTAAPGPAPTATPDTSVVTVSCSGTLPSTVDTGQTFGPLSAVTVPADAAAGFTFTWNLGNNTTVTSPSTGNISYTEVGTYAISVQGTNAAGATVSASCGSVTVGEAVVNLSVSCSVSSVNTTIELAAAKAGDTMRVTTSWTPADAGLYLQYEFETTDDLIIVNPATSGDSQTNAFSTDDGVFSVFWRSDDSGETGRLGCAAYPGGDIVGTPTPTVTSDVAATPTPTTDAGATPTPTTDVSPTPTPTPDTAPTPTPTPTTDTAPTPTPTTDTSPTPTPTV